MMCIDCHRCAVSVRSLDRGAGVCMCVSPPVLALIHKHFPAYCLFASRKARSGGKKDIVTLVHIKMAARASLRDISKEFAPLEEQAPEALARVHFVRILDPEGQAAVLLGNIHQYQAKESIPPAAVLSLIQRVIARWGADSQHVIVGGESGDWNASLAPRPGYTVETVTSATDARFAQWVREVGLSYIPPISHTWTDGRQRAVLDAFVVREAGSLDHSTCVESRDPRHDHRAVLAALLDERIGPMPELEALFAPVRLKLEARKESELRRTYGARQRRQNIPGPQETRPVRSLASRESRTSSCRWPKPC
jgi:hypothetical protein